MKCRIALAAVVALAAAFAYLAAGVNSASAYVGDPAFDPQYITQLMNDYYNYVTTPVPPTITPPAVTNPFTSAPATAAQVQEGLATEEIASGMLGGAAAFSGGTLILGAGALYTGWQIGTAIRKLTMGSPVQTSGTFQVKYKVNTTGSWTPFGDSPATTAYAPAGACTSQCWLVESATAPLVQVLLFQGAFEKDTYCVPDNATGCTYTAAYNDWAATQPGQGLYNLGSTGTTSCGTAASLHACYVKVDTWADFATRMQIDVGTQADYSGATTQISSGQATYPTTDQIHAGQNACGGAGGATNASCWAYRCWEAQRLVGSSYDCSQIGTDPTVPFVSPATTTTTIFAPFYLPTPLPGELYDEYLQRLQSRLWVGTATLVDDSTAYPLGSPAAGLSPGSVTQITTGATTVNLYDPVTGNPVAWPTNPPQVATQTQPVTIKKIPGTEVSVQTKPDTISWTPITSISYGTKFPFGAPGWLQSGLTGLTPSGACPTLTIPYPAQLMGGSGHVDIPFCNSTWETDYRPWVFPLLEALMTILGVAFVAFKIIGLHQGDSDP